MDLYEFKCKGECENTIILLEADKEPNCCPYCGGDIDYSSGRIEPVLVYTPR